MSYVCGVWPGRSSRWALVRYTPFDTPELVAHVERWTLHDDGSVRAFDASDRDLTALVGSDGWSAWLLMPPVASASTPCRPAQGDTAANPEAAAP